MSTSEVESGQDGTEAVPAGDQLFIRLRLPKDLLDEDRAKIHELVASMESLGVKTDTISRAKLWGEAPTQHTAECPGPLAATKDIHIYDGRPPNF